MNEMRRVGSLGFRIATLVACAWGGLGCAGPAPVVDALSASGAEVLQPGSGTLRRVALFVAALPEDERSGSVPHAASRFAALAVADELGRRGVEVVAADDVHRTLGLPAALGPAAQHQLLQRAASELGATGVLRVSLARWREREGGAYGSRVPASVDFRLALFRPPHEERVWWAKFDETQVSLSGDLMRATRYPGGGFRWLTAEELTRWGVSVAVDSLVSR